MRTRMEVLRGFGVVVLAACGPQAPEYDAAADVQAINEVREREWAAFSGGSVDDLVSVFASDARVMPPDAPAATGEAEIRAWGQAMADGFTIAGGDVEYVEVRGPPRYARERLLNRSRYRAC